MIVAVERGTPLADVLRAQAQDVRDTAKRELMESAGKKEIGMMVPLVFGVLPLTVVFAVFPGLAAISLGFVDAATASATSGAEGIRTKTARRTRHQRKGSTVKRSGTGWRCGSAASAWCPGWPRLRRGTRGCTRPAAGDHPERGDVPGWVMITLMSAVLVAALLALAGPALEGLFNQAMDKVGQ